MTLPEPDPITRARLRNERFIAILAGTTALSAAMVISWRIATVEAQAGWKMLAFTGFASLVFAQSYFDPRPLVEWKLWLRSTFEASCGSVALFFDMDAGPEFIVTSSTPYVYLLAAAMSCLRLRPALCFYVAAIGVVQQSLIFGYTLGTIDGGALMVAGEHLSLARFYQELVFRLIVLSTVGVLGVSLARTLRRELAASAQEAVVRSAFGSYVDARVVALVLKGDLKLKPQRRVATVLFVDIRDFTRFSEGRDPEQVFEMLAGALDAFAIIVQKQGGIVNKFLGDGLMALFNAPEAQEDHARRAVRAALFIAEEARMLSRGRFPGLKVGVGVHTGEVVVGDLGGARREYTAIGDVVNVASRVEAANKELGTTVLVTEDVRNLLGRDAVVKQQIPLPLRGRTGTVALFEVIEMGATVEREIVKIPKG